jgi:hypothetical protein
VAVNARSWILYSAARVAIFAVILVVMLFGFQVDVWISAIVAAIVGLIVSMLVLRPLRDRMALDLHQRSAKPAPVSDDVAEDAELGIEPSSAQASEPSEPGAPAKRDED